MGDICGSPFLLVASPLIPNDGVGDFGVELSRETSELCSFWSDAGSFHRSPNLGGGNTGKGRDIPALSGGDLS